MLQQVPTVIIKAAPPSAHPYLDAIVGLLPTLIAVAGGLWAVYKYLRDKKEALDKERDLREQSIRTAKTESQKPFSAKQQQIYFDLLDTTSLIANLITDPNNDLRRKEAIQHFWVLFWGSLPVVADKDVAIAADAFSVALDKPMDFVPLRNASMDLARACRKALGEAWSLGLEQFDKSDAAIAKEIPPTEEFYPDAGRYSA
jgi:hypothetical protein